MGSKGRRYPKNNSRQQQINTNSKFSKTSSSNNFGDRYADQEGPKAPYNDVNQNSVPVEKSRLRKLGDSFKYIGAAIAFITPICVFSAWITSIHFKVHQNKEDISKVQSEDKEFDKKIIDLLSFKISSEKDIQFIKEKQNNANRLLKKLSADVRNNQSQRVNNSIQPNHNASVD